MSLHKRYVRDGKRRIIGSVTNGLNAGGSVVRDEHERILGRTSEQFQTTRDSNGDLISINSSDPGLLFRKGR